MYVSKGENEGIDALIRALWVVSKIIPTQIGLIYYFFLNKKNKTGAFIGFHNWQA